MPLNTFSPKKSFTGKVVSVEKIVGPKATGETYNVVIETNGDIPYWEGQSYGVIPPVCPAHSALPTLHRPTIDRYSCTLDSAPYLHLLVVCGPRTRTGTLPSGTSKC